MFLNPVMLAGIGAAVVPLILHFLSRSRFRTVDWGGMMFLGQSDMRQRAGMATRQWTLLALRMSIVGLLAMALARPVVAGWWGHDAAAGHRLIVLILDCSGSMAVEEAGRPRLESAKESALRILSRLHPGDQAALIEMGRERPDPAPSSDLQSIATRIASLTTTAGAADVAESLTSALDLCDRTDRAQPSLSKEIYLLCDRQARSWDGVSDAFVSSWQTRWDSARRSTRLYLLPAGGDSSENVAIESLDVTDPPIVRGQPSTVEIRLRNYGAQPRPALPVTLSAAGQQLFSDTLNLDSGSAQTLRTIVKFPTSGPQLLTATLRTPDMPADNHATSSLTILDPLKVLILATDEKTQPLKTESSFLSLALAPFAQGSSGANLATVTVAKGDDPKLTFDGVNVIILANLPKLPDPLLPRLEQFVYSGGGLLIAPGPLTQIPEYRRTLYRNGAGLMPADLHPPRPDGALPTSLLGLTLEHPVFRFLRGGASPIPAATVARYFPADPRQGDSHVLASYATGDPFLVEGTFGRGRVLLVTTPLDADWSDLPLTNVYLPFVQSCIRYLSNVSSDSRNLRAGDPLSLTLDPSTSEKSIHLLRPDSTTDDSALEFSRTNSRLEVRYQRTRVPGEYTLFYPAPAGANATTTFSIRPPSAESDLTPLGEDSWDRLRRSLGFEELSSGEGGGFLSSFGRFRSELWLPLVAAVLGLMLLETLLSRFWSGGGNP